MDSLFVSIFNRWKKDPLKAKLCLFIPMLHLLVLGILLSRPPSPPKEIKPLIVKTFQQQPLKIEQKKSVASLGKHNTAVAAAPKRQEKKVEKKTATPATKPTPRLKPKPKSASTLSPKPKPVALEKHLKEMEERIAKIEAKNDRMIRGAELKVLPKITLSSETFVQEIPSTNEDYSLFLIDYLQRHLQLPDVGEVKIQVRIRPDGTIENMKVVQTESEKNKRYLEEHLSKLTFPPPDANGKKLSSQSFLLTFYNEF